MNAKPQIQIRFKATKRGVMQAYRYCFRAMRWFRISMDDAIIGLAIDTHREIYKSA